MRTTLTILLWIEIPVLATLVVLAKLRLRKLTQQTKQYEYINNQLQKELEKLFGYNKQKEQSWLS